MHDIHLMLGKEFTVVKIKVTLWIFSPSYATDKYKNKGIKNIQYVEDGLPIQPSIYTHAHTSEHVSSYILYHKPHPKQLRTPKWDSSTVQTQSLRVYY